MVSLRTSSTCSILLLLAGCTSVPETPPPLTPGDPWSIDDIAGLELPVLFVNGSATYIGSSDLSRFSQIPYDRDGSEAFRIDAANRTIWFWYPDVIWQACGMKGVVVSFQDWQSPVSDTRLRSVDFMPVRGRIVFEIGTTKAFARVSDELATVKLETAARNGDLLTVVANYGYKQWNINETRAETGRLGISTYERVELEFANHVEFAHAGTWRLRLHPDIIDTFENQTRLYEQFLSTEYPVSPYCH